MMNQELFAEVVKEKIKDYLPERFQDFTVEMHTVNKVNMEKMGLTLRDPNAGAGSATPSIYIDDMYEHYKNSDDLVDIMTRVAKKFVDEYEKGKELSQNLDMDNMKDNVIMVLVNTEQNKELLETVPHREFEDLSIIYRWVVSKDENGIASTIVNNDLMKQQKLTEPELFQAAVVNTKEMMPAKVKPMSDIIKEMMMSDGMPEEVVEMMIGDIPDDQMMWVISNEQGINGAVNMIYEENLHMISERLQDNLYILPSSIHETIAVPASMGTPEELAEMVHDANMNVVQLSERLSNQVYHYDKDARKLTIATDSQHKRLDGLVSEMPMVYEDKNKGR